MSFTPYTFQNDGTTTTTATSTDNDGGTAKQAGNVDAAGPMSNLGHGLVDLSNQYVGVAQVSNYTTTSNAGVFAYSAAENYVIKTVSATLTGLSNTVLKSGASDKSPGSERSINKTGPSGIIIRQTSTAMRAGYWNAVSGIWTTSPNVAADTIWDIAGSVTADDTADAEANSTAATPGEFTIHEGKPNPTTKNYGPRYGGTT